MNVQSEFVLKKPAFTFSEVLLTITVLVIVAAMTMPGLISNYKIKVYVVQLEKSLSQFEQAMQNIMVKHECTDMPCTSVFDGQVTDAAWNKRFGDEITKSIKIINTAENGSAMSPHITSMSLKPKETIAEALDWRSTKGYKFMTPDGAFYLVEPKQCEAVAYPNLSTLKNICAEVTIDVNSQRLPNQYGRDIFKFVVGQNGHLYAMYGSDYARAVYGDVSLTGTNYWASNASLCAGEGLLITAPASVSGYGCAARVIESNWKMTY